MTNIKAQVNKSAISYDFNNSSVVMSGLNRVATKVLANFFSSVHALASKPVFTVSGNKVVINVFYYIADSGNKTLSSSAINSVGQVLSKLFRLSSGRAGTNVELRLVKLHYPYLDSYILAQYIAINTGKYNFSRIIARLWGSGAIFSPMKFKDSDTSQLALDNSSKTIPAYITGIKVKLSGRLVTERSVPRQTVKTAAIGTFSTSARGLQAIDSSSFTAKNKKGSFTIKVSIAQVLLPKSS